MSFQNLLLLASSAPSYKSKKDKDEEEPKDFTSFIMEKMKK